MEVRLQELAHAAPWLVEIELPEEPAFRWEDGHPPMVVAMAVTTSGGDRIPVRPSEGPRVIDGYLVDQVASEVEGPRSTALSAQLNDQRNWSDTHPNRVGDDLVIMAMRSPRTHRWLAVKAYLVGRFEPGQLGSWQQYPMPRYEAVAFLDVGSVCDCDLHAIEESQRYWRWYEHASIEQRERRPAKPGYRARMDRRVDGLGAMSQGCDHAAPAEHAAFQWASQLREQLAFDQEGWDSGVPSPESWRRDDRDLADSWRKRAGRRKLPSGRTFEQAMAEVRAAKGLTGVRKLPPTRAWTSSPFAGMRNQGAQPDEA